MHILGSLDRPTAGRYLLNGKYVSNLPKEDLAAIRNKQIGFVFPGFNLLPRTTAAENVEVPLLYSRPPMSTSERKSRALEALESLGLSDRAEHHPSQLSGGQQQRVAIARALVNKPSLILADEPTGNLDSTQGNEIMEMLSRLNDEGTTIVMVTHSSHDASYSQRIIRIMDGQVVSEKKVLHAQF